MGRKGQRERARRGEGSIGKYRTGFRGLLVVVDALGRKKRTPVYGQTEGEVRTKMMRLRISGKRSTISGKQLLRDYLDSWLEAHAANVVPKTIRGYKTSIEIYLKPLLGHLPLDVIEPSHVKAMMSEVRKQGKGPRTQQATIVTLKVALEHALESEIVDRNVAARVKSPRVPRAERIAWTPRQVAFFFQALRLLDDPNIPLYRTALRTGMRESELFGLQWRWVDFDRGIIGVERRLDADTRELGTPKTRSSRREIPITATLVAELRAHRKDLVRKRMTPWVFPAPRGEALRPSNVIRRSFRPAIALADALARAELPPDRVDDPDEGVPWVSFHDLRHTAGVLMRRAGVDLRTISDILGHSSVAFTQTVYGHIIPDLDRSAIEALDRVLNAASDEETYASAFS